MLGVGNLQAAQPRRELVCIDLQPNTNSQAPERKDILNIGGFSDSVFDLIAAFAGGTVAPTTGSARSNQSPPPTPEIRLTTKHPPGPAA